MLGCAPQRFFSSPPLRNLQRAALLLTAAIVLLLSVLALELHYKNLKA